MDPVFELRTEHLLLRSWRDSDLQPLEQMIADPRVMADLPTSLTVVNSETLVTRSRAHFEQHGFGLWAIEIPDRAAFIGFAGLWRCCFESPLSPCIEIGWRLAVPFWGRGHGTEAAAGVLGFAFERLQLPEVVSFTVSENRRSRRVMEKLGMRCDPSVDFEHPLLPPGHPLSRQVLYRIDRRSWDAGLR